MRTISSTLLAAQQSALSIPYVKLTAADKMTDVKRLKWVRLYGGSEEDYYYSLTIPGDGSLIRVRVSAGADSCKLYLQRVVNPGPESDFNVWTYTGQYGCQSVAAASNGSEVSIIWANSSLELKRLKSADNGANWGTAELIGYVTSSNVSGMAAAYKPNGDIAIFFTGGNSLYVLRSIDGVWQNRVSWDKTTGSITSVASVFDGDWHLLVAGQDASDNYKVWSLVYGDGDNVPVGTWSELKELASAPAGGNYSYCGVSLDKPDVYRTFYIEKYDGNQSYNRPCWTHNIPGVEFPDSLWREPVPFNLSSEYGLAIAHHLDYCWLSSPSGVWRAMLAEDNLELTGDIVNALCEVKTSGSKLLVELRNDDGRFNAGSQELEALDPGCQLDFSLGYVTPAGNEISPGLSFWLQSLEYVNADGKASLILCGIDGWQLLDDWRARHQFRWNKDGDEVSVKGILEFVLARVGLKLAVKSQSAIAAGFYPDFTIHPGDKGVAIVNRLLSFVPDVIFIEGATAFLVNPSASDTSVYSYGVTHAIKQSRYLMRACETNYAAIEGYDPDAGEPILFDSILWDEIGRFYSRPMEIIDKNLATLSEAQARGETYLRKAEISALSGAIRVPVNCGQQLYDAIEITDINTGLSAAKRRVLGFSLHYRTEKGEYYQQLTLGGV